MSLIEEKKEVILDLCKKCRIKELYIFGSILRRDFDPDSDIDFAVVFYRDGVKGSFDQYFDFKTGLEAILDRRVDLVCLSSIRNEIFKNEVNRTKRVIYAA